jgi:hypothetical protein
MGLNRRHTTAELFVAQKPMLMSALGQKQTSRPEIAMSALPPKADIRTSPRSALRDSLGSLAIVKRKEPRPNVEALKLRVS